jgi:hypothetical protein
MYARPAVVLVPGQLALREQVCWRAADMLCTDSVHKDTSTA